MPWCDFKQVCHAGNSAKNSGLKFLHSNMKDLYCQLSENPIAVLAAKGGGKFEKRSVSAELMVKIYALNFAIFLYYGLN